MKGIFTAIIWIKQMSQVASPFERVTILYTTTYFPEMNEPNKIYFVDHVT